MIKHLSTLAFLALFQLVLAPDGTFQPGDKVQLAPDGKFLPDYGRGWQLAPSGQFLPVPPLPCPTQTPIGEETNDAGKP